VKNVKEPIRKIVNYINNPEEQGGLWLPHIQRKFVWDTDQIEALFDSIMREYPISTLLIWKTKDRLRTRKFIDNYTSKIRITDFYIPPNNDKKLMVLDGQQRLQSFYIALKGSYEGRELYINILSGDTITENNIKYQFKFLSADDVEKNWIKLKDLVFSNKQYDDLSEEIITKIGRDGLSEEQKKLVRNNVARIVKLFKTDEIISYQELDSIDDPELYSSDDVVEIFIRANSGGTQLEKSDLLFSLLTSNWEFAEEQIQYLQDELNRDGFNFTRDFILKTCLCLLDVGARYDVKKFRDKDNLEKIENNWQGISDAIKDVKDFIVSKTFIKSDRALPSYLALIPVIYFRYNFKDKWNLGVPNLNTWLLRALLTGAFSGSPDGLIDQCTKKISETKSFDIGLINNLVVNAGRNINVTDDIILSTSYGDRDLYLLFNLWYSHFSFNFIPSYEYNAPQIDHIFPQSRLKEIKIVNPETGRRVMKYREFERDQIANCMLLTAAENGAGGKADIPPDEWFEDKDDDYLNMHLIPNDPELWKIDNYEKFVSARKELLVENLKKIINA
jgi:uncharacterized protein with ParB-like and HNH nuclease domain